MIVATSIVNGSVPIPVHLHETKLVGVLPEPYRTFELNIKLDVESDDVVSFELYRGDEHLVLPKHMLSQLKAVELHSIRVSHEMHRFNEDDPAESQFGGEGDWLHITMDYGKKYRAEKKENGKDVFRWGQDKIRLTVTKDKSFTIEIIKVTEMGGYWHDKTW